MNRSTVDKLISWVGLVMAVVLFVGAGVLLFAHSFVHKQVVDQLASQRINFPTVDSAAFGKLPAEDQEAIRPYAGQALTTGAQAKVYAENYIGAHLQDIGGGLTYAELSDVSRANPNDAAAAAKVQTVFRGETLRGLLLNAYAFDTMAVIAKWAAFGAIIGGGLLFVLALFGFNHSVKSQPKTSVPVKKPTARKKK